MVTAPIFGAQLISGILFFGGDALTLTSIVTRAKHTLMADMHPANFEEIPTSPVAEQESVLTPQDVQFLSEAKIIDL